MTGVSSSKSIAVVSSSSQAAEFVEQLSSDAGNVCVDHFRTMKEVEAEPKFPIGSFSQIILDTADVDSQVDSDYLANLRNIFGNGQYIFIDNAGVLKNTSELQAKIVKNFDACSIEAETKP